MSLSLYPRRRQKRLKNKLHSNTPGILEKHMLPENSSINARKNIIPLENIRIAEPCRADWNLMEGDDRARFCQTCAKNVYNLSAMTKEEAEQLITEKEGKLCARFYQRADGTILTGNCPVGVRTARRPFQWLMAGFAVLLASGVGLFVKEANSSPQPDSQPSGGLHLSPQALLDYLNSKAAPPPQPTMGVIACPPPTPTPAPTPTPEPPKS